MSFSPEAPRPTAANADQGARDQKKGGAEQDNAGVGSEASSMRERFSTQVLPKGLDVLSSNLCRRRAKGQQGREVRGAHIISATDVREELGKGSLSIQSWGEQQGSRATMRASAPMSPRRQLHLSPVGQRGVLVIARAFSHHSEREDSAKAA